MEDLPEDLAEEDQMDLRALIGDFDEDDAPSGVSKSSLASLSSSSSPSISSTSSGSVPDVAMRPTNRYQSIESTSQAVLRQVTDSTTKTERKTTLELYKSDPKMSVEPSLPWRTLPPETTHFVALSWTHLLHVGRFIKFPMKMTMLDLRLLTSEDSNSSSLLLQLTPLQLSSNVRALFKDIRDIATLAMGNLSFWHDSFAKECVCNRLVVGCYDTKLPPIKFQTLHISSVERHFGRFPQLPTHFSFNISCNAPNALFDWVYSEIVEAYTWVQWDKIFQVEIHTDVHGCIDLEKVRSSYAHTKLPLVAGWLASTLRSTNPKHNAINAEPVGMLRRQFAAIKLPSFRLNPSKLGQYQFKVEEPPEFPEGKWIMRDDDDDDDAASSDGYTRTFKLIQFRPKDKDMQNMDAWPRGFFHVKVIFGDEFESSLEWHFWKPTWNSLNDLGEAFQHWALNGIDENKLVAIKVNCPNLELALLSVQNWTRMSDIPEHVLPTIVSKCENQRNSQWIADHFYQPSAPPAPPPPLRSQPTSNGKCHPWSIPLSRIFQTNNRESTVKVAIIDSGCDLTHPEFHDTNVGAVCDLRDHITAIDASTLLCDPHGHGTMVASIVAGRTVGVFPEAELYIGKLDNDDGDYVKHFARGIQWAIAKKVDVISISIGCQYDEDVGKAILLAVAEGIVVVASSSNNGALNSSTIPFPASLGCCICVGSHGPKGHAADRTGIGRELDFLAPGEDVSCAIPSTPNQHHFMSDSGCSFATPAVAGLCGLLIAFLKHQDFVKPAEKQQGGSNSSATPQIHVSSHTMRYILRALATSRSHSAEAGYGCLDLSTLLFSYDDKIQLERLKNFFTAILGQMNLR